MTIYTAAFKSDMGTVLLKLSSALEHRTAAIWLVLVKSSILDPLVLDPRDE